MANSTLFLETVRSRFSPLIALFGDGKVVNKFEEAYAPIRKMSFPGNANLQS